MAKLSDDFEKQNEESTQYFQKEKLRDYSELRDRGCLTLAQCVSLIPHLKRKYAAMTPRDASQMAVEYNGLIMHDIKEGKLSVQHPQSSLSYSRYLDLKKAGEYGADGNGMPVPHYGWLVTLDDAKQWFKSNNISVNFDALEATLAEMAARATKVKAETGAGQNGDDFEKRGKKRFEESKSLFLVEKRGDFSALRDHECLTVGQCTLLIPYLNSKKLGDVLPMAKAYMIDYT